MTYVLDRWDWKSNVDKIEELFREIHEVNKEEFEFSLVNKLEVSRIAKIEIYLIKKITGEIVGLFSFADITKENNGGIKHCAMPDFVLLSRYQRKGLGLKLMKLVESFLVDDLGFNRIEFMSRAYNENANKLYRKLGYSPYIIYWERRYK